VRLKKLASAAAATADVIAPISAKLSAMFEAAGSQNLSEQADALGEVVGAVAQRRAQLAEAADGVVGVNLVLTLENLQGEEPGGQVVQAGQRDAEAHRVQVAAQRLDLAAQRVELLGALQDQGVDLLAARCDVVGLLTVAQDLDVDSLGLLTIATQVEERFGVALDDSLIPTLPTVGALVDLGGADARARLDDGGDRVRVQGEDPHRLLDTGDGAAYELGQRAALGDDHTHVGVGDDPLDLLG